MVSLDLLINFKLYRSSIVCFFGVPIRTVVANDFKITSIWWEYQQLSYIVYNQLLDFKEL